MTHDWVSANERFLERALERLRLLLQRRALWLIHRWQNDDLRAYRGAVVSDRALALLLASDDEEAERRFFDDDATAHTLDMRIDELEATLRCEAEAAAQRPGRPPAIEELATVFALEPFARDVMVLAYAAAHDERIGRACAYLNDDLSHPYPTVGLALGALVRDPAARPQARDAFAPGRPLRRFRLITWDAAPEAWSLAQRLALDERMVDRLRGMDRLDVRLVRLLTRIADPLVTEGYAAAIEQVERAMRQTRGRWPRIDLIAEPGQGAEDVAAAACKRLEVRLFELSLQRLGHLSRTERAEVIALAGREAILLDAAYFAQAPSAAEDDYELREVLGDLAVLEAPLLVCTAHRRTDRSAVGVAVPRATRTTQRALWQAALAGIPHAVDGGVAQLAEQFDFGPRAIAAAVEAARDRVVVSEDAAPLRLGDLWRASRALCAPDLERFTASIEPIYGWEDIVLPPGVLAQLREIAAQVACRAHVYERWGFGRALARGRGITALFCGESGTGKTMAAEVLGHELALDLYRVDLSSVVSKYIGETEKHLRGIFDAAERGGAILFFDEADALFGKRTEVRDSHDRYANIEVDYLLQRMDEYRGLAILATNRRTAIDTAFLRRLRFVVEFPFPDQAHRRRMWELVFPATAARDELDYAALSRLEIVGGHIRTIALNAAFLAASEGVPIGMAHVMRAAGREYHKLERALTAGEFGPYAATLPR